MKICLYLEYYNFLNGILFKKIGTGLLSSYKNQKDILTFLGLPFCESWDASCDILQINTPWLKSIYLMKKAKKLNKKVFVWSHVTAEDAAQVFRFVPLISPLLKRYLAYAYGLADTVLCPTQYTKSLLLAYGLPEKKLIVQSNGVDLKKFYKNPQKRENYRKQYRLENITVGTVGLVIPRKGTETFINSAKKLPGNSFVWYGKKYSSLLVKPLPSSLPANCIFTGFVDDQLAAFNSLDIFIFPSYEENEGMAILEAAAVGLPILVRDIPVYDGWLVHGENCLKAKDDQEFIHFLQLLSDDQNLREKLGEKALAIAASKSKEVLSKNLLKIYSTAA